MDTKPSPREFSKEEKEFMMTLNERQRRRYAATQAMAGGCHGVRKVSDFFGISQNTVYAGIREHRENDFCKHGRVRRKGGGRKRKLDQHPEWIDIFKRVMESHTAGLPQDEGVVWISLAVPRITEKMNAEGCPVTDYTVRQIIDILDLRYRSFSKSASLKEMPFRDEQFKAIEEIKEKYRDAGLPVLSIDTKKKELVGIFVERAESLIFYLIDRGDFLINRYFRLFTSLSDNILISE